MRTSRKVVSIRSVPLKREVLFLDAEDKEIEVVVQTDEGKIDIWDWIESSKTKVYQQGYREGVYCLTFLSIIAFIILLQTYFITFFYQTDNIINQIRLDNDNRLRHHISITKY